MCAETEKPPAAVYRLGFCGKRAACRTLPSFYALESWNMRLTFFKTQFPLLFPAKRHVYIGIYWENSKGGVTKWINKG